MVNVNAAVSPSASVAVHVYSVRDDSSVGVPVNTCVVGSRVTPLGSAGVSL